jgi:hypothetical protein
MVNSPVIPDSELVLLLTDSIAKSRFPGAYDAHKSHDSTEADCFKSACV